MTEIKRIKLVSIVCLVVLNILLLQTVSSVSSASQGTTFQGLSGYSTDNSAVDQIIALMNQNNLDMWRASFTPSWQTQGTHAYDKTRIQYFLDHSSFIIIVDRNHQYPQTSADHWSAVQTSVFDTLQSFPNNRRVWIELINEYNGADYYTHVQALITTIRNAGYTNTLVCNKIMYPPAWQTINDPLNSTFQGNHYYFNAWSTTSAINDENVALSKGIPLLNTEVGASFNERADFNSTNVGAINSFLSQSASLGVSSMVWMRENLENYPTYQSLGLVFQPGITVNTTNPNPNNPILPENSHTADLIFFGAIGLTAVVVWTTERKRGNHS